ncbi:MAG: LEA type 2 family protein [Deltaproteobacteria bacterium]|nr:LEA type 2 family protein [Deltaproteobacteria bacterium]
MRVALFGLLAALLLTSCAALRPVAPEVNLMGLVMDEVTLSHINLVANLRLFNPNDVSLSVEGVEYELRLNGVRVSSGQALRRLDIGAREFGTLDLRLASAYADLFRFFNEIQHGEELDFRLTGKIQVGGFGILGHTFAFDQAGKIPLAGKNGGRAPFADPLGPPRRN